MEYKVAVTRKAISPTTAPAIIEVCVLLPVRPMVLLYTHTPAGAPTNNETINHDILLLIIPLGKRLNNSYIIVGDERSIFN
jgi:hypothetical protein